MGSIKRDFSIFAIAMLICGMATSPVASSPVFRDPHGVMIIGYSWGSIDRPSDSGMFLGGPMYEIRQQQQKQCYPSESNPCMDEARAADADYYAAPIDARLNEKEFIYSIELRNTGSKVVRFVAWSYIFRNPDTGNEMGRHDFVSETKLAPGETKTLCATLSVPPTRIITASMLARSESGEYSEAVQVKAIRYDDGTS